jgi:alkylation response protein AidB-like acyl-CoA dehydrogenase
LRPYLHPNYLESIFPHITSHEHQELQRTLKRFIDSEINPHVDEWEAAEIFPAHEIFKKMGDLGLLGLCRPTEYGGMGLDYSFSMAIAETLGPMKTPGISVAKKIKKIGMNASDTGLIYFDDVRVPQHYTIGQEGMGFTYQMMQFQEERLWASVNAMQALTNCINWTIDWARERQMFGGRLLDNQYVYFKLAELKTEVEALRALTYRAGELFVSGKDVTELASMAKLKAGRLMRIVLDACLQFWSGMGYTLENLVARMFRDGRLASIGAGADEVMLGIIAKNMGILPGRPGK